MPATWIVALLIVPGSFAVAAIAYARESLSAPMRWTLVGLRTLSFLLLFAVLFRPVFVRQEQSVIAPEVLFLFDGSGSMAREDGYVGDDEARDAVRALTGESETVLKHTDPVGRESKIQEKKNMIFSGTAVSNGACIALVVATGMSTEIGKIQADVSAAKEDEEKTPLGQKIDAFGELLAKVIANEC